MNTVAIAPKKCRCETGPEWSGSLNPEHPDTEWLCDDCGRVIPATPPTDAERDEARAVPSPAKDA